MRRGPNVAEVLRTVRGCQARAEQIVDTLQTLRVELDDPELRSVELVPEEYASSEDEPTPLPVTMTTKTNGANGARRRA